MATLQQIADEAGVSVMTVSNVLNRRNKEIWPSAKKRAEGIRKIARDLGYRPNTAARQMRTQQFGAAAAISRPTMSHMHHNVLKGLSRGMARHGMHLLFAELDLPGGDRALATPRMMKEMSVDGIVVHDAMDIPKQLVEQVESLGMPVVWINTAGDHDCVDPDDRDAARQLTRAVIELGHRKIGYVGPCETRSRSAGHYSLAERVAGHLEVMRQVGLPTCVNDVFQHLRADMASELLATHVECTVWICQATQDAGAILLEAIKRGLRVPQDLSIVTFRNDLGSPAVLPFLMSGMENPLIAVGERAADMLVRKIADPDRRQPVELVPWQGPHGETLAAPPDAAAGN